VDTWEDNGNKMLNFP